MSIRLTIDEKTGAESFHNSRSAGDSHKGWWYHLHMSDCLFCKIARGEIPSKKIYEDDELFAFHDINPQAPVHFLVIPKKHIENVMAMEADDIALAGRLLFKAQEIAANLGCSEKGARFVVNCKSDGGQSVDHLHMHILGGRRMTWPPG
jgi:histidine triad (HIT) family protein